MANKIKSEIRNAVEYEYFDVDALHGTDTTLSTSGVAADAKAAGDAISAAMSAEKHVPQIGENGNWLIWDTSRNAYVDSGFSARGEKGDTGETGERGPKGDTGGSTIEVTQDTDGLYVDEVVSGGGESVPSGSIDVDDELSDDSENPVQNKVVKAALDNKQDTMIASGAAVGQIAKITAVDANGKPTAWEAVDIPSGSGKIVSAADFYVQGTITPDQVDDNGDQVQIVDTGVTLGELRGFEMFRLAIRCDDGSRYFGFKVSSTIFPYIIANGFSIIIRWLDTDKTMMFAESGQVGNSIMLQTSQTVVVPSGSNAQAFKSGATSVPLAVCCVTGIADSTKIYVGVMHKNGQEDRTKNLTWCIQGITKKAVT